MTFKNNFERDIWYCWYERILSDEKKPDITPEAAAAEADKILVQLQNRSKE